MIGFLRGTVAGRTQEGCFLDVQGVGYRLACSATTLAALPAEGAECRLWTHVHVREDALALFGFATEGEQRMFEALIGVAGVGPKVALQVCSAFGPDSFRRTLATDDVAAISSIPGIGKKTAQRIILDLKEKLSIPDLQVVGLGSDALAVARSALENLGYSAGEVRAALGELQPSPDDRVEEVIKSALKVLA
jgi:Holliday junction DNA helicase RuvA